MWPSCVLEFFKQMYNSFFLAVANHQLASAFRRRTTSALLELIGVVPDSESLLCWEKKLKNGYYYSSIAKLTTTAF